MRAEYNFEIVNRIISCSTDTSLWRETLDLIANQFGAKSAIVYGVNAEYGVEPQLFASTYLTQWPALEDFAAGRISGDERLFEIAFSKRPRTLTSEVDMFGVADRAALPMSEARRQMENFGLWSRLGSVVNTDGPWLDVFSLHTGDAASESRILCNQSISTFLPIIGSALSTNRIIETMRARYNAALAVLDKLDIGIVLVNVGGEVIFNNAEASRIFESDDGISLTRDKQVVGRGNDNTAKLRTLLKATALAGQGEANPPSMMTVARPSGEHDYIVSTGFLYDSLAELEVDLQCGFVIIIDPIRKTALDSSVLERLGGLTEAEAQIVRSLVQGSNLKNISSLRDTSIHTVRNQTKSLQSKLHCKTQADIIRLAAITKLPLLD